MAKALAEAMEKRSASDLKDPHNLFCVLANLPLEVYITTNYHDLMEQALKRPPNPKEVRTEFCRWWGPPALGEPTAP